MTTERYEELLGRLLDGALASAEAEALAQELKGKPERRDDVKRHLVLWELWEQAQVPERGAEAFVASWRTRLRAESENPEAFTGAVRSRIDADSPRAAKGWLSSGWRRPSTLLGAFGLASVAAMLLLWLATPKTGQAMVRLEGEAVCAACVLHESREHTPALRVAHDGRVRIVYLDRNEALRGNQRRFCGGPVPAVAEGRLHREGAREQLEAQVLSFPPAP